MHLCKLLHPPCCEGSVAVFCSLSLCLHSSRFVVAEFRGRSTKALRALFWPLFWYLSASKVVLRKATCIRYRHGIGVTAMYVVWKMSDQAVVSLLHAVADMSGRRMQKFCLQDQVPGCCPGGIFQFQRQQSHIQADLQRQRA